MTFSTARSGMTPFKSASSTLRLLSLAASAYRQRRALARLEDAALIDLGLTRREAQIEANRPLWDVPATWRR